MPSTVQDLVPLTRHPVDEPPLAPPGAKRRPFWRQWPLPASLLIAIVYWLYLNEQVMLLETPSLPVQIVSRSGIVAQKALNLRVPSSDYVVTELRDAQNKVFNLQTDVVTFTIRAPGGLVRKMLSVGIPLLVDVKLDRESEIAARRTHTWKFTRSDVKDANGEIANYIEAMDPPELTVFLKLSGSISFGLAHEQVAILTPPSGDWNARIFKDSLEFAPTFATLVGPRAELEEVNDNTELFVMDLTRKLEELKSWRPDERKVVATELRLKQNWLDKGIRLSNSPLASVRLAPKATNFTGFRVRVAPDWLGCALNPSEFQIDDSLEVDITSYSNDLSNLLADRKEAEKWLGNELRCFVRLSEIDPALDPSAPDFRTHLEPHYYLYDRSHEIGRDLIILKKSLIQVTRKAP